MSSTTPRVLQQTAIGLGVASAQPLRVSEQALVAVVDGQRQPLRVSEQYVLQVGTLASDFVLVNEQYVLQTGEAPVRPVISEQYVLLIVNEQVPTVPVGSWTYQEDGHLFYALNLGVSQGTVVFDTTTGRWSSWKSGTLPFMNMNLTVRWRGAIYGASLTEPVLLRFDPSVATDEGFRVNTFIASGRIQYEQRQYVAMPEAQIFGSLGLRGGNVTLRYSNDDGASYITAGTRAVAPGARGFDLLYFDLGSMRAPGRLFEIEDSGTLRRISGLKVQTGGG